MDNDSFQRQLSQMSDAELLRQLAEARMADQGPQHPRLVSGDPVAVIEPPAEIGKGGSE